jgi:hypothetical protein
VFWTRRKTYTVWTNSGVHITRHIFGWPLLYGTLEIVIHSNGHGERRCARSCIQNVLPERDTHSSYHRFSCLYPLDGNKTQNISTLSCLGSNGDCADFLPTPPRWTWAANTVSLIYHKIEETESNSYQGSAPTKRRLSIRHHSDAPDPHRLP